MSDERWIDELARLDQARSRPSSRNDDALVAGVLERVASRRRRRRTAAALLVAVPLVAWFARTTPESPAPNPGPTPIAEVNEPEPTRVARIEIELEGADRLLRRSRLGRDQLRLAELQRSPRPSRPSMTVWVEGRWRIREQALRSAGQTMDADALRAQRNELIPTDQDR